MAIKIISNNRKARHNYEITETFEAGLVLLGSEVKSLRNGNADLKDSYGTLRGDEIWLIGAHISPYEHARNGGHDPERSRKLLLHRHEIERIRIRLEQRGLTLVPLRLYFKDGKAKVEVGLGRGKSRYDKRETLKRRQADREMERAMRHRDID
jgi:SsrA-binding protein